MRSALGVVWLMLVAAAGCGDDDLPGGPDAARDAGAGVDAAGSDGGASMDAARLDSGGTDGGAMDARVDGDVIALDGAMDASTTLDASALDARIVDAAPVDSSFGVVINVVVTHPSAPPIAPATECTVTTAEPTTIIGGHVTDCSELVYDTVPPCMGPHYGVWADFHSYAAPVPWGYLVHSLEHGATVIAVSCGAGCPTVVPTLQAFIDAYAADPLCTATPARSRIILVPDPTLDVAITASTWGHLYRATCLDIASLTAFLDAHYGMAPENVCDPGADFSGIGWCPPDAG